MGPAAQKGVLGLTKRRNSFVEGAFILIAANLATKVIGAIFKIPLGNMLGADGMGLFYVAYNIYTALFVISTAGLPVAISKMVSEANALGRPAEGRRILSVALTAFSAFGLLATGVLWFGAGAFTRLVGNSGAMLAVRAVAPSLFFVSVMSVIRGYYQGLADMVPTAVSQVLEALGKLVLGYLAAKMLLGAGYGLPVAAAGAIGGVTFGSAVSTLYLVGRHLLGRRGAPKDGVGARVPRRSILKRIILISVPVMVGASVLSLTNLIDMAMVMNRLQDIGFSEEAANTLYGSYGLAQTLFNLPQTLVVALSVSIIPAVSAYYARRSRELAQRTIHSALRIASLIALPSAAGFLVLAGPILDLIYYSKPEDSATAAPLLAILGAAVFFVAMVSLTNSILQAVGRVHVPVYTMLIGGAVKLAVNYVLVGTPQVNISGAPIGTALCYVTIALLNLAALRRAGLPIAYAKVYLRPAIAAGLMGLFTWLIRDPVMALAGGRWGVLPVIALAALFYGLMLLAVRALPLEDVLLLPKGDKIAKILRLRGENAK